MPVETYRMESVNRKRVLLGFLYENNQTPITGVTWMQKMVFFLQNETGLTVYDFEPRDMGPFSEQLYEDTQELEQNGYVVRPAKTNDHSPRPYTITEKGKQYYQLIIDNQDIDFEIQDMIRTIKSQYNDTASLELLHEVQKIDDDQLVNCTLF